MLYVIWGISFLFTIIYAFNNKNSKVYRLPVLIELFIFMWILSGWSSGAYDVEIGISRYVNYASFQSFTEIGYNSLIIAAHSIGMNYRLFFVMCSLFELVIMFWFVEKNSVKSPIVFGLFLIYPSFIYFQYIRNIFAFTFVLIALDALINKKKGYIIKYIIFIVLATTIHASSLFFLLYLPISFIKQKTAIITVMVTAILLYFSAGISQFSNIITSLVGQEKTDIVLRTTTNAEGGIGRIFGLAFSILTFFIIFIILKYFFKISMKGDTVRTFVNINLLSFIFIPLTLNFGVGFARIPTLLCIVNYVFLVNKISEVESQKQRLIIYFTLALFLIGSMFLNIRNIEYRQLVFYPFFNNNELMRWLFY
uniref:Polysaccharide polymerase Eps11O n=1 Tax=Lactiplantibacillus paraplantarum TaxID=60520 RepID=T2KG49_9LACO|nr:polysaccharide polymerase Eps11O [Lactiplantibacillus paraplantarum]